MDIGRRVRELIVGAVREEIERTLQRAVEPIRENVDEAIVVAVRRAAAPIEARFERLVNDAARRTLDRLVNAVAPERKRRRVP